MATPLQHERLLGRGGGSLLSGGGGSSSGTLTDVEQDIDVDRGLFVNRVKLKPWPRFALGGGGGVEEGGAGGGLR